MRRLAAIAALGLLCLDAAPGRADESRPRPAFECRWADGEITIDGEADEPAWQHAQVIDRFTLPWLGERERPAGTATKARLLWDRRHLYFFAEMEDADLFADVTEHDGKTWDNDVFELFFKPAEDKPGYYEFQVNAANTRLDMFLPERSREGYERFKSDGDFGWEAKVARRGTLDDRKDRDEGWSVEGRIPWQDFLRTGGRPAVGETWRFALCRYDYSADADAPELSTCAPLSSLDRPDFHHHEDYADLTFTGPRPETAARPWGIREYAPVTTSRVVGSPEPPLPYRAERVLPDLKLSFPIFAVTEPGTRRLWLIDQQWSYGPARVARTTGDPSAGEVETLLKFEKDGVAYDVCFHPDYETNGYVYVGSNATYDGEKQTRVTRYTVGREPPHRLDPESAKVIIQWPSDGHNGGALAFGNDGMLYVTSGDGTSDSDTNLRGQDMTKLTAKVLRIDVDHPADGQAYSVPADNPFVGQEGIVPETWCYGLRNPWRMSADRRTGQIWVGNNGQDLWEQAYLIERGANYGWSVYEGSHAFYAGRELGPTPAVKPTVEHPHSEARSLTGGVVYHGTRHPELQGAYIYGDYSTGKIWGVKHEGGRIVWHRELADTPLQITCFGLDPDGELLIADHQGGDKGGLYTLVPNPDDGSSADFPRRLSESGLFRSVKDHALHDGAIPYSVNAPLWSDGAHKERYIVLPPTMKDGEGEVPARIDVTLRNGWNFPDRTVLVKSFALEAEAGDPASRRWIETRFLTKQQGEWVGYSYRWNEDQTDAVLVDKEGADVNFTVRDGERVQTWHYPSRTECMVCHSRAANFVLGLSLPQLNKEHDYGGVKDNQLRVLEGLGVLRVNWQAEAHPALRKALYDRGLEEKEVNARFEQATKTDGQRGAAASSLLFQPPEQYERLADPYDESGPVDLRARSYLHANCAQCHVEAGGGNAQMKLDFPTPADKMNVAGAKPLHGTFGVDGAKLVAPGEPERSVLLKRVSLRGRGQMPQLATSLVDEEAVRLLRRWIAEMRSE